MPSLIKGFQKTDPFSRNSILRNSPENYCLHIKAPPNLGKTAPTRLPAGFLPDSRRGERTFRRRAAAASSRVYGRQEPVFKDRRSPLLHDVMSEPTVAKPFRGRQPPKCEPFAGPGRNRGRGGGAGA